VVLLLACATGVSPQGRPLPVPILTTATRNGTTPPTPSPTPFAAPTPASVLRVEDPVFNPSDEVHVLSVTFTLQSATEVRMPTSMACPGVQMSGRLIDCPFTFITCQGAVVRYTTDGSAPTANSLSVGTSGRIVWDEVGTTVFKAMATRDGWLSSNITEQT
jgi:hypothetical protein